MPRGDSCALRAQGVNARCAKLDEKVARLAFPRFPFRMEGKVLSTRREEAADG